MVLVAFAVANAWLILGTKSTRAPATDPSLAPALRTQTQAGQAVNRTAWLVALGSVGLVLAAVYASHWIGALNLEPLAAAPLALAAACGMAGSVLTCGGRWLRKRVA
jgi:hypothetical protein